MKSSEVAYYKAMFSLGSDIGSNVEEFAAIIKDMSVAEGKVSEGITVGALNPPSHLIRIPHPPATSQTVRDEPRAPL